MKFIILLIIILKCAAAFGQNSLWLWPIPGQKAGESLLYKPEDLILTEKNYDNLFIHADEGTPVLAPAGGIVVSFSYIYYRSLSMQNRGSVPPPNIKLTDFDKQQRRQIASSKNVDDKFVSISITIAYSKDEDYYISGLRPFIYFKTGQKIKKGDTIGYVGYVYKQIDKPCIAISRSINTKAADPMSPFGLKSSFVPYKPKPIKPKISVPELMEDFTVFRQSLEEGHPGLYDYTSHEKMDSLFEQVKKRITKPMSSYEFLDILTPVIGSIRDSHTSLINVSGQTFIPDAKVFNNSSLPVHFGYQNDSLFIFQTLPEYKHLLRKQIVKINNESAEWLLKNNKLSFTSQKEGYNTEGNKFDLLTSYHLFYKLQFKHQKGDTVHFIFSDGSSADLVYRIVKENEFVPKQIISPKSRSKSNFEYKRINKQTAYIKISTFELTTLDEDSIRNLIKGFDSSKCDNLIIDLRNNLGGNGACCNLLFAFLVNQPYSDNIASMVKSNGKYSFFKYTTNYGSDSFVLFPDYKKVEDKDGYYMFNTHQSKPDDSTHFGGKVYLIVNENSKSAASMFAALIHKYKRGTIIGRETGSCYYQMNAVKFANVRLNNSQLELNLPLVKVIFDNYRNNADSTIPWGRGVIPDKVINWTYDEYFSKTDPILDYTFNQIKELDK